MINVKSFFQFVFPRDAYLYFQNLRVTSGLIIWFAILQRKLYLVFWLKTRASGHNQRGEKSEKLDMEKNIYLAGDLEWNLFNLSYHWVKFWCEFFYWAISSNFSLSLMFPAISCKCVIHWLKTFQSLLADANCYRLICDQAFLLSIVAKKNAWSQVFLATVSIIFQTTFVCMGRRRKRLAFAIIFV